MMTHLACCVGAVLLLFGADGDWPLFRGEGNSLASTTELPLEWSATDNIAWRSPIDGYGQSSPVVRGNRVFITSVAGEFKDTLIVTCFALETGATLWRKEFQGTQKVRDSNYVSKGAPTPAVDTEHLYAFFESGDLIALDHGGKEIWKRSLTKDYGPFEGNHGLGSSLSLTADAVVVLVQQGGASYLLAVDRRTGENRWKRDRAPGTSWSTPLVVDGSVIVVSGAGTVAGFDAATGAELWSLAGLEGNNVPSPTLAGPLVVVGAQEVGSNLAVRMDRKPLSAAERIAWRAERATSSFASPLVDRGRVYFVNKSGVLYCLDADTGTERWTHRLPDSCWASPIAAGDRLYFFTKGGETIVLAAEPEPRILAHNSLPTDDRVYGVAVAKNAFLVRTGSELVQVKDGGRRAEK